MPILSLVDLSVNSCLGMLLAKGSLFSLEGVEEFESLFLVEITGVGGILAKPTRAAEKPGAKILFWSNASRAATASSADSKLIKPQFLCDRTLTDSIAPNVLNILCNEAGVVFPGMLPSPVIILVHKKLLTHS